MKKSITVVIFLCAALQASAAKPDVQGYRKLVAPLIESYCMDCHDNDTSKGDLSLEKIDGNLVDCGHEAVRAAEVIGDSARAYWPMDLVEPFVRQNWYVFSPRICRSILIALSHAISSYHHISSHYFIS